MKKLKWLLLLFVFMSCKNKVAEKKDNSTGLFIVPGDDTLIIGNPEPIHDTIFIHDTVYRYKKEKQKSFVIKEYGDTLLFPKNYIVEDITDKYTHVVTYSDGSWVYQIDTAYYKIKIQ